MKDIEESKDNATKMFKAISTLNGTIRQRITVHRADGSRIVNKQESVSEIRSHFHSQFSNSDSKAIPKHSGSLRPLDQPVTSEEVEAALKRMNNGKSAGPDNIQVELLKHGGNAVFSEIAEAINSSFSDDTSLDIGDGLLIPLLKPGKPAGPTTNLRPIVLLNAIRKVFSIIYQRESGLTEKWIHFYLSQRVDSAHHVQRQMQYGHLDDYAQNQYGSKK